MKRQKKKEDIVTLFNKTSFFLRGLCLLFFISQQPFESGSYFRLCKILLYQSFAVLLKINYLQHKPVVFSTKKKSLS